MIPRWGMGPRERRLRDLSLVLLVVGYGIAFALAVLGHDGGPTLETQWALVTFLATTAVYGCLWAVFRRWYRGTQQRRPPWRWNE